MLSTTSNIAYSKIQLVWLKKRNNFKGDQYKNKYVNTFIVNKIHQWLPRNYNQFINHPVTFRIRFHLKPSKEKIKNENVPHGFDETNNILFKKTPFLLKLHVFF